MMTPFVDATPDAPLQGGGTAPAADKWRPGDHPAWRRALERAAASGAEWPADAGIGLLPTPVAVLVPVATVHGPALAAPSVGGPTSAARPGAEPSRYGEDPAGVAGLAHEGRRRHAGMPLHDAGAAASLPVRPVFGGADNPACRGLPGLTPEHRLGRADAPSLRVHVEADGASASVWIGVDARAAHVLDEAVAAVSRWLMREGCAETRWVCNGREFEAPGHGRLRGAASLPVHFGPAVARRREQSSGGTP